MLENQVVHARVFDNQGKPVEVLDARFELSAVEQMNGRSPPLFIPEALLDLYHFVRNHIGHAVSRRSLFNRPLDIHETGTPKAFRAELSAGQIFFDCIGDIPAHFFG